ncbi:MAG: FliH/SctL family protein [Stenotrophomonas sp.]
MNNAVRWQAPDLMAPAVIPLADDETATPEVLTGYETEPLPQPPTLEDIQAIQDAAQQEGFEQGHIEGYAQGQSEVRRLIAQIEGILDNFTRPLARLENEVVGALGDLSVRIAGTLVGRAYEAEPALLGELVSEAIDAVGGTRREVEVRLHPDDIAALAPLMNLPAGQRLSPDLGLSRGDLRVHAESVRIDGTLDARLRAALGTVMRRAGAGQ